MAKAMPRRDTRADAAAHFMFHPETYAEKVMGFKPDPHQAAALKDIGQPNSRVLIIGANGMGKDATSSILPEWFMQSYGGESEDPAIVPTTSASGRQVKILWQEINNRSGRSLARDAYEILVQMMRFKTNPRHYSVGFKAGHETTIEGYHAPKMVYIMTEGRGAPDWAYNAMFKASTDVDNRIWVQSVPGTEDGEFFQIASGLRGPRWKVHRWPAAKKVKICIGCEKPFKPNQVWCETEIRSGQLCGRSCYVALSPRVSQESIDEKLMYGEDSAWFVAPVLAEFTKGSSLALMTLGQFLDAVNRYDELDETGGLDILGVDLAWVGQAETVLAHRRGPRFQNFIAYQGERTTYTITLVKQWMEAYPHGLVVIEHGIAQSSVIDSLYADHLDDRLVEVDPGGTPFEPLKFKDRRSELYFHLAQRFESGHLGVPEAYRHSPLGGQLVSIRKRIRGDMVFEIESKREMFARLKKESGKSPSPDWSDACMLTMAVASEEGYDAGRDMGLIGFGDRTYRSAA